MSPRAMLSTVLTLLVVCSLLGAGAPARADEGPLTRTLTSLPARPASAPLDGVARGHGMERESLEVALAAGARLEARVTNGAGAVRISLMTDNHDTDVETLTVPADGTWRGVAATAPSAVFVRSQAWATAPVLEYRVLGQSWTVPAFRHGDDQTGFVDRWQSSGSPFAVIDDAAVTILVPRVDLMAVRDFSWSDFVDLDAVIEFYRHLIGTYDSWLGLSADASASIHANHQQRPFLRPDANGWGLAYYLQGAYIGTNVNSVQYYLQSPSSWLILHELGHGYDGIMTSPANPADMPLGEVWNNVYAYLYQTSVSGLTASNWLNEAGKEAGQSSRDRLRRAAGGLDFQALGHRERLDVLTRVLDATGPGGLIGFNMALRELRSAPGFTAWPSRTELIARHWGQAQELNLLPWFEQHALPVSDRLRTQLFDVAPTPIALPLSDIVPGEAAARSVARDLGLDSSGALVTPRTLGPADLTGSVTVRADGDVDRRRASLHDGTTTVATATFSQGVAHLGQVPAGAYTLRLPADRSTGVVPEPRWVVLQADSTSALQVSYSDRQHAVGLNGTDLALLGLGDVSFASVRHDRQAQTVTLTDTLLEPHVYFSDQYARVQVSHAGRTLLDRSFIGNAARPGNTPPTVSVPAAVGTTVTITHREPGGRVIETDPRTGAAKPSLNATSVVTSYVVTEHGLARTGATSSAQADLAAAVRGDLEFVAAAVRSHPQARLEHLGAGLLAAIADLDDPTHADALTREFGPLLQRLLLPVTDEVAPTPTPTPTSSLKPTPTASPTQTAKPTPTRPATPTPTRTPAPSVVDVYSTPGLHHVNGRVWFTECEPYSRTTRCRTEIQATQVVLRNGAYVQVNGFVFNNLTYLPEMTRAQWAGNPLGHKGSWTAADGRQWSTECDTAATGRGGCRSYVTATVIEAVTTSSGTAYRQVTKEIFNNMVRFKA